MKRRNFITLLGGVAAAWPARAQTPAKQYRIAIVHSSFPAAGWRASPLFARLLGELRRLGYIEGQTLIIEYYTAEGHIERYDDVARTVASHNPEVIVTVGDLVPALKSATSTIPIVAAMGDPLISGYVTNLARPGGNLTGVSTYAGFELVGKRLELLKEATSAARIAVVNTPAQGLDAPWRPKLREFGAQLGVSLLEAVLREVTAPEIERGFAELARQRPDAILLGAEGAFAAHARLIVRLAAENRLPTMYGAPNFTNAGGLMAYSFDPKELARQIAEDVRRILDGAKPGDIPIYQATRFKLVINLKTAKALGLTVPQSILARADEVIE